MIISCIFISCHQNQNQYKYKYNIKDTLINNIEFVFVPKGKYTFGIGDKIKSINYDYWIMKYEVTNLQYYNFLKNVLKNDNFYLLGDTVKYKFNGINGDLLRKEGDYTAKILDERIYQIDGNLFIDTNYSNHPVTEVTWFGATAYCVYYGFKLPNVLEWEKAARGVTGYNYPWGDNLELNRLNCHNSGDPFDNNTTPVGFYNGQKFKGYQTKDSPSPYGCYDMAGNAWENLETIETKSHPLFLCGGGGGYLYHYGAMCQTWYHKLAGIRDSSARIDRPFKTDGFRCLVR